MRIAVFLVGLLLSACVRAQIGSSVGGGIQTGPSMEYDPQIVTAYLDLMGVKDNTRPSNEDFTNSSLKDILVLGTPAGFHLRNRYIHLGVSLAQGLSFTEDKRLKEQLIEIARWERSPEIRAVGLIAMASRREEPHIAYFREALMHISPEVRFAALEALEVWDRPKAKEEFARVIRADQSPVVRIYAAQALARRGDPKGLEKLREEFTSGDWVARAMAARYLGDHGEAEDYDILLNRLGSEQGNNFVGAEIAIAALKLFPKKEAKTGKMAPPPPAPPGPDARPSGSPPSAANLFIELETLVITAPRLKIPANLSIDGRINNLLLKLLEDKADERPKEEILTDPSIKALNSLSSPGGFQLKTRYTELGFLLTEGLAGTADLILRNKLVRVAQSGLNQQTRAAALVAVAYNRDPADRGLFQEALLSQDITVRFGALEALQIWGRPEALTEIGHASRLDASLPVRLYAAAAMLRLGNPSGRDVLIRHVDDQDWMVRAMANRYLGEFGTAEDFGRVLFRLQPERNNFVRAEMCGALLRLHALKNGEARR